MNEMCTLREPYKCACCGQEMLFFTTANNMLIDYKRAFNKYGSGSIEFKNYLANCKVRYLKCIPCNKTFVIDWTSGYPTQVTDKNILTRFMHKG